MKYKSILNEIFDTENNFTAVPKNKYETEHAPYTFYIKKSIQKMEIYFTLPTPKDGNKEYAFLALYSGKGKYENWQIHFYLNENESLSPELTNYGNAASVFSGIIYFTKLFIKMYDPDCIHIVCKNEDESRKRVYRMLAKTLSNKNGFTFVGERTIDDYQPPKIKKATFISIAKTEIAQNVLEVLGDK